MDFQELYNKDGFYVNVSLEGDEAESTDNYGMFWVFLRKCFLVEVALVYGTAGSDAGAVTLNLEKLTGTTASGSGISLFASSQSLKATANTVYYPTLVKDGGKLTFDRGDRIGLKDSGTLTAVNNLSLTCYFRPVGKGHYN